MANTRLTAVNILKDLFVKRVSLASALPVYFSRISDEKEKAWIQEVCYGVTRYYFRLDFMAKRLFERKSLKEKDLDIYLLVLVGLYQLLFMRTPDHAAVYETVKTVFFLKKSWAAPLVNATLRSFLRRREELQQSSSCDTEAKYAHPEWMIKLIQDAWPENWPAIIESNNEYPPLVLRVNTRKISRDAYFEKLKLASISAHSNAHCQHSIILTHPMDVSAIPGFSLGEVTVQDSSAQLAAELLDLKPNQRVLDACSAPGGKTSHLLEFEPNLREVVGLDNSQARLLLTQENLTRLGHKASLIWGDAAKPSGWFDGVFFDRILLDAPCSSTGVVRRHPEVKILRRHFDITELSKIQLLLLESLWQTLARKGKLLYATCSVLPHENECVIKAFLEKTPGARSIPLEKEWGIQQSFGRQILSGQDNMDGFYYALLEKSDE